MKYVRVKIKRLNKEGTVLHVSELMECNYYVVRVKGSGGGYRSAGLFKASELEIDPGSQLKIFQP